MSDALHRAIAVLIQEKAGLHAEIERLQATQCDCHPDSICAENKRLRALLHRWIVWNGEGREHDLAEETRRALAGEKMG